MAEFLNGIKGFWFFLWTVRILALVGAAFIALFAIGDAVSEGIPNPAELPTRELVMLFAFLVWWIGLLAGWKNEAVGGLLVITAFAVMQVAQYTASGEWLRGPYFPLLAMPGLLYLIAYGWRQIVTVHP